MSTSLFTLDQLTLLTVIEKVALQSKMRAFLVGGIVRDLFLGHELSDKDLDFIIEGNAIDFAMLLEKEVGGTLKTFPQFVTAKITRPAQLETIAEIDLASARTELYQQPGALPKVSLASIDADLKRRDFTINALALPITALTNWIAETSCPSIEGLFPETLDQFGGIEDLEARVVRVLHSKSFIDDPTRIFRACRYAVRIDGSLSDDTQEVLEEAVSAGALSTISHFRVFRELQHLCDEQHFAKIFRLLAQYGVSSAVALYEGTQEYPFLEALERLETYSMLFDRGVIYAVVLRLIFYFHSNGADPGGTSLQHFMRLGFSKRDVKAMQADVEAVAHGTVLEALSLESLVLAQLVGGITEEQWHDELERRNLSGRAAH